MGEQSYPRLGWNARAINEAEHENLIAPAEADGFLNYQSSAIAPVYADATGLQFKARASVGALVRGSRWITDGSGLTVAVTPNASGSTRIDRVVLRQNRSTSAGSPASTWAVTLRAILGTPGAGVMPPLVQNNTTDGSGVWDMHVGQLTVANGASTINGADFTFQGTYIAEPSTVGLSGWGFPATPAYGQTHTHADTGAIYKWNGTGWDVIWMELDWQDVNIVPGWSVSTGFKIRRMGNVVTMSVSVRRTGANVSFATDPRIGDFGSDFWPTVRQDGIVTSLTQHFTTGMYVDTTGNVYLMGDGTNAFNTNSFFRGHMTWTVG